ncbi:MAG: SpoIIIAH-like family protein [Mycobacterium leprae]
MFIVKKRSELIRFGLFLLLAGLLAYYVAGRFTLWRATAAPNAATNSPGVVAGPIIVGPQGKDLVEQAREATGSTDFFAESRMNRERNRGALRSTLQEVMQSQSVDPVVRKQASEQYLAVGRIASLEDEAENLIRARGFEDVLVHLTDGSSASAQVVVKGKQLTQEQYMQIVDMVSKIGNVKPASIVVIAKEK